MNKFWYTEPWISGFDFERAWQRMITSYSIGEVVDTEKFDIINGEKVPRKDYRDRLLEENKKKLKELDESYEKRKKEIAAEREELLKGK